MSNRQEAVNEYNKALKQGKKYYKTCTARGESPYLMVLDEQLEEQTVAGTVNLGLIDIPMELIAGVKTTGRSNSFAGNFMPLLEEGSEFGTKWIQLCQAHLGDEGIRDPIYAFEYLGRFYIQEGNKRVSVLKNFGAASIPGTVVRILPMESEEKEVQLYYEFLQFYELAGMYQIQFRQPGCYKKLQAALGFEADKVWSEEERRSFSSNYYRFRTIFETVKDEELDLTPAEALLLWLEVYSFSELNTHSQEELIKNLSALWPDIKNMVENRPITVSMEPQEQEKKRLKKLLHVGPGKQPKHLNVAFLYSHMPNQSQWAYGHHLGRQHLETVLGDKITVREYCTAGGVDYMTVMEQAVQEGAEVLFATAPPMIGACRKIAARYPKVRVLNCSLSTPYTGVRTYYSRVYEAKFITGAIAGIITQGDQIGYVANYPILGVPSCINAFALGARMTNPGARIQLHWSCLPGNPVRSLMEKGVHVISNRDISLPEHANYVWDWGSYQIQEDGSLQSFASPCWKWGNFYEQVIQSIFDGTWNSVGGKGEQSAVNYWWGMDSGVIDVELSASLPDGVQRMAGLLKKEILEGTLQPFQCSIRDQSGVVRNDGSVCFTPEEIMGMDWLCDHVEGEIPAFETIRPSSQELVRLLGVYRDKIPPEPEEMQL